MKQLQIIWSVNKLLTTCDTDDLMGIKLLNYHASLPPKIPIVQHRVYLFYIKVGQSGWHQSEKHAFHHPLKSPIIYILQSKH